MSGPRYWSVTVSVNGEPVLTIGRDELAGVTNIDDFAHEVREAGKNLLDFTGPEDQRPFIPDDVFDRALELDGEKLRQLNGEDHGPWPTPHQSQERGDEGFGPATTSLSGHPASVRLRDL